MANNQPFENRQYDPVQDVTGEEAERNKRRQAEQEARIRNRAEDAEQIPGSAEKSSDR